jgi:hypothetical protein
MVASHITSDHRAAARAVLKRGLGPDDAPGESSDA